VAAGKIAQIASAADPRVVLGLATGSSPVSAYEALETRIDASTLDLCLASAFALDEYVGLPVGHPQSCRSVIHRDAANPLRLASDPGDGQVGMRGTPSPVATAVTCRRAATPGFGHLLGGRCRAPVGGLRGGVA